MENQFVDLKMQRLESDKKAIMIDVELPYLLNFISKQ